ncbi:MAG: acyl carrier protein, partial [Chitinophagaceae bacterium]
MDKQTILETLKKILAPYTPDKEKLHDITGDTRLLDDLHINSANLVDIIIDAETNFNIEIDIESMGAINTVGNCV